MPEQTNIKRFKVKDTWKDFEVVLEVDLDRLTAERAQEINSFWSSDTYRLRHENGDVVRTVIRLAGQTLINAMLSQGGSEFSESTKGALFGDNPGPIWTKDDLHNEEGWGGTVEEDGFGWCGIRVVAAEVHLPEFGDVALSELNV